MKYYVDILMTIEKDRIFPDEEQTSTKMINKWALDLLRTPPPLLTTLPDEQSNFPYLLFDSFTIL